MRILITSLLCLFSFSICHSQILENGDFENIYYPLVSGCEVVPEAWDFPCNEASIAFCTTESIVSTDAYSGDYAMYMGKQTCGGEEPIPVNLKQRVAVIDHSYITLSGYYKYEPTSSADAYGHAYILAIPDIYDDVLPNDWLILVDHHFYPAAEYTYFEFSAFVDIPGNFITDSIAISLTSGSIFPFTYDYSYGQLYVDDLHLDVIMGLDEETENLSESKVDLYPNPLISGDHINLSMDKLVSGDAQRNWIVSILNSDGHSVLLTYNTNRLTSEIDLSGLPNGLYFVTIEDEATRTQLQVERLIISR